MAIINNLPQNRGRSVKNFYTERFENVTSKNITIAEDVDGGLLTIAFAKEGRGPTYGNARRVSGDVTLNRVYYGNQNYGNGANVGMSIYTISAKKGAVIQVYGTNRDNIEPNQNGAYILALAKVE